MIMNRGLSPDKLCLSSPELTHVERDELARLLAIELLELAEGLLAKVRRALMASDAEAFRGVVEAVKFLWLVSSDRTQSWTPSHRVDLVWHEMILFTRAYERFCCDKFGAFVHHQPSDDHAGNKQAFAMTVAAYRTWFGEPDDAFWGNRNSALAACGNCDAGE